MQCCFLESLDQHVQKRHQSSICFTSQISDLLFKVLLTRGWDSVMKQFPFGQAKGWVGVDLLFVYYNHINVNKNTRYTGKEKKGCCPHLIFYVIEESLQIPKKKLEANRCFMFFFLCSQEKHRENCKTLP